MATSFKVDSGPPFTTYWCLVFVILIVVVGVTLFYLSEQRLKKPPD